LLDHLLLRSRRFGGFRRSCRFSAGSSHCCNPRRQIFDFLSGRCEVTREDLALLMLLRERLSLLGGRSLGCLFSLSMRSTRCRHARRQIFDFHSGRCEVTREDLALLTLLRKCLSLLGGRSLSCLFSLNARRTRCRHARRQIFDFLSGRCEVTREDLALLMLLRKCLSLLGGRSLGRLFSLSTRSTRCR
jgi:hypothetical protein